jgi:hypothetical protein
VFTIFLPAYWRRTALSGAVAHCRRDWFASFNLGNYMYFVWSPTPSLTEGFRCYTSGVEKSSTTGFQVFFELKRESQNSRLDTPYSRIGTPQCVPLCVRVEFPCYQSYSWVRSTTPLRTRSSHALCLVTYYPLWEWGFGTTPWELFDHWGLMLSELRDGGSVGRDLTLNSRDSLWSSWFSSTLEK